MRGYFVERHAGWDTHGLPIEIEAEKTLGIKSKKDIEKIGVGFFNQKARESIWKYKDEWERFTDRIGFWLDLDNPYVTYDWKYIETLWWIIKETDKKKLLYTGHKILPWCPRCGTALSSHEVAQGYEDVTEDSVIIKFKVGAGQKIGTLVSDDKTYILAWTTTPWTLPGNVALAVGKNIEYLSAKFSEENYILAKDTVGNVFGSSLVPETPLVTFHGSDLIGLEYEPLFDVPTLKSDKSYKIYPADFVTTEDGTGVVHTAIMYGEDDYELGKKNGLPMHHTVGEDGRFTKDVKQLEGAWVKDAEKEIIAYLESRERLFNTKKYTHSYPFCWRCKSPLLYYARDSWFIAVSKLRKQMVKNNRKVHWYPDHLKLGRFGEFIKDAKDWAFSRERYWGTPMPVWQCEKCDTKSVIGSLDELEAHSGRSANKFFILRHGLSEKDFDDGRSSITAGRLDKDKYHLTQDGAKQIEKVAQYLKESGGVDLIFSSPFLRTKETAEIVSRALGLNVHFDDRLKEIDHGSVCEGQPRYLCVEGGMAPNFKTKYGDGDSWHEVKTRACSIVQELNQKHEGKNILLVSHGDPLWIIEGAGLGLGEDEMIKQKARLYAKWGELKQIKFRNAPRNEHGDIDLHRPYVDEFKLECPKCNNRMIRVKEITDVWFDSGSMPYAQWHYPFENKRHFSDNFPADFIGEGIDQTRGWFYTLLVVSTLLEKGAPYKHVLSYSHVLDNKGRKMSKSVGNTVDPWEVIDKFGADAARWYFYTINDPADPKLFAMDDVKKVVNNFVMTIMNSLRFFDLYGGSVDKHPRGEPGNLLDRWLLSQLAGLSHVVSSSLDDYNPTRAARAIESFVINSWSNWWLRRSRARFQHPVSKEDLNRGLRFFRFVLIELSKFMAPFTPLLADHLYKKVGNRKESVHFEDWVKTKKDWLNVELDSQMGELRNFISDGLALRKDRGIKIRQPLASITIKREQALGEELEELMKDELNVKKVLYDKAQDQAVLFDEKISRELLLEGYAREIMRQIQDMRKEAKYRLDEKVFVAWDSESTDVIESIEKQNKKIISDTLLKEFKRGHQPNEVFDIEKESELAPQVKIWLGVRK